MTMTTTTQFRSGGPSLAAIAAALALAGTSLPASAALAPATFDEYVGIGGYSVLGADAHAAESVSLTVLPGDWDDRGGGTGHAWIDPVNPVSTAADLHLFGGSNLSGIGATAVTTTRYEFTVVALDPGAPPVVELLYSGYSSVLVASNQEASHSFARVTVFGHGQFSVQNYDAHGAYTGFFDHRWDRASLGSFTVGSTGTIVIEANTHGEGFGPGFAFDSAVFVDPMISLDGPSTGSYRIVFSDGIVGNVPEPAAWLLLLAGLPVLRRYASGSSSRRSITASSSRTECTSSRA